MLPVNPNLFIQPLDLSDFSAAPPGNPPGFTQLVQDVLGADTSQLDGLNDAISSSSAIVDALDQALTEQDAALDAVLTSLAATDPQPLDNSLAGYVGTFDAGRSFVKAGQALAPPELLELPIDPAFGGVIGQPPGQVPVDLGSVGVGSAAFDYALGQRIPGKTRVSGVTQIQMVSGDPQIFRIASTLKPVKFADRFGNTWTDYIVTYVLHVTPAAVGTWIAQLNIAGFQGGGYSIVTFTLAVIP